MKDYFRVRTIEESLEELAKALNSSDAICLRTADYGGGANTMQIINRYLHIYLTSLDGLKLNPLPIGEGGAMGVSERKELERAKNSITLIDALADVLNQVVASNRELAGANSNAAIALNKEGLFTPKMVYQMKEDFETVSQLHTKYKKETARLIEEGSIATQRNAELRLEIMDKDAELKELRAALKAS